MRGLFLLQYTFNIPCRLYWQATYIIFDGHLGSGDSHNQSQLALLSVWFIPADSVQTTFSTCGEYSSSYWHLSFDSWLKFWCTTALTTIIDHRAIACVIFPPTAASRSLWTCVCREEDWTERECGLQASTEHWTESQSSYGPDLCNTDWLL